MWLRRLDGSRCRVSVVSRYRVAKRFPGYWAPSKPEVVSQKCMRCHSVVNTWHSKEREYRPHRADIPPASSPPDISLSHWIMELQINSLGLRNKFVGLSDHRAGIPPASFSTRYLPQPLDLGVADQLLRFDEQVSASGRTPVDLKSF